MSDQENNVDEKSVELEDLDSQPDPQNKQIKTSFKYLWCCLLLWREDTPLLSTDEGYLPESRQRTVTPWRTMVNILKMYTGSGILGLPFGFQQSGFAGGILILSLVALCANHCMVVLVDCKNYIVSRGFKNVVTFGDVARHAFGRTGLIIVDGLLIFTQIGVCVVYLVYISQNLSALLENYLDFRWFMLMWLPLLILASWIRSLKNVAPLTTAANFLVIFGTCTILITSIINVSRKVSNEEPLDVVWGINWIQVPTMFGIAVYAFEGIGIVIPSETAITKPEKYKKVLAIALILASINYLLFGGVNYLGYGRETQDQILVNMKKFAEGSLFWEIVVKITTGSLVLAIAMSFPLQLFVAVDILEEKIFNPETLHMRSTYWLQNIFRTSLVLGIAFIAVAVPKFGLLTGLIGASGSVTLQFIFPSLIYLKLRWGELNIFRKLNLMFYIFVGACGGAWGTYDTISQIIKSF